MAKSAAEYLKKGRLVSVEGKIRTRKYEKDNETKTATSIVADKWKALDANPQKKEGEKYPEPANFEYAGDDIPLWFLLFSELVKIKKTPLDCLELYLIWSTI